MKTIANDTIRYEAREPRTVAVLGSTGSVGEQALDVARRNGFRVEAISAWRNISRVEEQIREFHPAFCTLADEAAAADLRARVADTDTVVYGGSDAICTMTAECKADTVVNSIIGAAGLPPTLAVLDAGKRLALANKESLVLGGEHVMESARRNGVEILPVDSEHCAIFQCLKAGRPEEIRQILLTASGGPFYGRSTEELAKIRVEDALAHPTWRMGPKITVDSATLLNKGFEIIEAVHLFGVRPEQVRVLVHRQSIVHSMVEFNDHSVIAQLAVPDMRMCVQYAVEYPCRMPGVAEPLDLTKVAGLTFADPDEVTFPLLRCAKEAIGRGGALPTVLNAANEEAVAAFLAHRIGFTDIFEVVLETVSDLSAASASTALEERYAWDETARACAGQKIAARSASFGKGGLV